MANGPVIEYIKIDNADLSPIAASAYAVCDTATGTAVKKINLPGFVLFTGVTINVEFKNLEKSSTGGLSLKINDLASVPIKIYDGYSPAGGTEDIWKSGSVVSLTYNGSSFVINNLGTVQVAASNSLYSFATCTPTNTPPTAEKFVPTTPFTMGNGCMVSIRFTKAVTRTGTNTIDLVYNGGTSSDTAPIVDTKGNIVQNLKANNIYTFIFDKQSSTVKRWVMIQPNIKALYCRMKVKAGVTGSTMASPTLFMFPTSLVGKDPFVLLTANRNVWGICLNYYTFTTGDNTAIGIFGRQWVGDTAEVLANMLIIPNNTWEKYPDITTKEL